MPFSEGPVVVKCLVFDSPGEALVSIRAKTGIVQQVIDRLLGRELVYYATYTVSPRREFIMIKYEFMIPEASEMVVKFKTGQKHFLQCWVEVVSPHSYKPRYNRKEGGKT